MAFLKLVPAILCMCVPSQDPPAQQAAAQELYGSVALELLQQAAKALERALLDGGPCRWYVICDSHPVTAQHSTGYGCLHIKPIACQSHL